MAENEGLREDSSPEVAGVVTIYDAEYRLLEAVSRHEQNNRCSTPYASQYPSSCHDELVSMTLREVRSHQERRMRQNRTYQAVGRYQFIYDTLEEVVNGSGTSWDAIFDVETQDWLAIYYMRSVGLDRWFAGNYSNRASSDNDVAWHIRLAMIWAAIPVPITIPAGTLGRNAPSRTRNPGDSFYQGSLNSAGATGPAEFLNNLRQIRRAGKGNANSVNIPLVANPDRPRITGDTNSTGSTPGQGNYISPNRAPGARGGLRNNAPSSPTTGGVVGSVNTGASFIPYGACLIPGEGDPYSYKPLNQLDNRYDFRLGDKVRDLLENGQAGVSNTTRDLCGSSRSGNGGSAVVNGSSGRSIEEQAAAEAEVGLDAFGGSGEPERDVDGNLTPRPGESINDFRARVKEDDPNLNYSDYTDRDVDDVLSGNAPRQYNPNTGRFEYPLVSNPSTGNTRTSGPF